MKRFLGKCIEYAFVGVLFVGFYFGISFLTETFGGANNQILILFGMAFIAFPLSLLGGYMLARPIQHRLHGKPQSGKGHALRGNEKPHGVTEDRSQFYNGQ
ncbi:MAG: hypothetical protein LPJ96_00610 [Exiguobacterium sp.]|uniref:hypothetical protein n=1 Tax=Exiguobacterium TaxID=33986 RepID=UPI001BEA4247|nr:hypothetical protein [Exiguobacterium sp. s150]MDX5322089.1 hypothetical protein [Exiguobacterium sp.]MDX5423792.1 hypothetical protein [Exiguobacterium sp.]MDX6771340.1 hypothetical protein [Exiguobacterium sp.]